jgi:hypothetical protein
MFKDQNLIFTQFSKAGRTFTVRKWKPKGDEAGEHKAEIKIEMSELADSSYDKIIKGQRSGITVLHEDDRIVVFNEAEPVAKTHIIVLAKAAGLQGLHKIDTESEEHKALLGHMMVTASKVASEQNLQDGYRIVTNNGSHAG